MKRYLVILTALLGLLTSCTKEKMQQTCESKSLEFVASMGETKTTVADNSKVYWCPGDQIKVFQGGITSGKFTAQITENAPVARFKGTMDTFIGAIEDNSTDSFYTALYPYSENTEYNSEDDTLPVTVLSSFNAVEGSFPPESFPSVAKSANMSLAFYNICGGIIVSVAHSNITKIEFRGNKDEFIAGEMKVGFQELPDGPVAGGIESLGGTTRIPEVHGFLSGSMSIKVLPPVGKSTFTPGVKYYIPMFPTTFSQGFSLKYYVDDNYETYTDTQSRTIKRSTFANLLEKDANLNLDIYDDISDEPLPGIFTVNKEGKKVQFSRGNLYWNGSKFKFERHQYDFPRRWDPNHVGHFFWSKDIRATYVEGPLGRAEKECGIVESTLEDTFCMVNGGAIAGWTVLSLDEWCYFINKNFTLCTYVHNYNDEQRSLDEKGKDIFNFTGTYEQAKAAFEANARCQKEYSGQSFDELINEKTIRVHTTYEHKINGIGCIILKPDGFSGTVADNYTTEEWAEAEKAGLVALPLAAYRYTYVYSSGKIESHIWGSTGCDTHYWSSTPAKIEDDKGDILDDEEDRAGTIYFVKSPSSDVADGYFSIIPQKCFPRSYGASVRLVKVVE